ncbi:MAG: nuclear transport factor 2 family protein [Acidimicrobiia bacterium]
MDNAAEIVRTYLDALTEGPAGLATARELLADDLEYHDPMMSVERADDLIAQLRQINAGNVDIELVELIPGDGVVASLTSFAMPNGERVPFTQWFWVEGAKITRSRVIYDPRPFLELGEQMQ